MILLARHGETDDNVPPYRFQGQRDTPLNECGRAQARELAERVAALDPPIASLWCSDLSRARETAEIVGARIGLEPRADARLREGWRGEWEGFLFEEIAERDPERYAAWRNPDGAEGFRFPGGESLREQQARVLASLADIAGDGGRPSSGDVALVVCHGGSIRTVLCARDPRGLAAFHTFTVPNVALVPVEQAVLR
ncbi:MAG TPA: histidine phosphatase family protein [Conexibacter sp.]|nr:histidine phosphatase family protein [Conexibacter sp.]